MKLIMLARSGILGMKRIQEGALSRRRRPYEAIIADIIKSAVNGSKKTRIMYGSALNMKQLNQYLAGLVDGGFLRHDAKQNVYYATSKGMEYLRLHNEFVKAMERLSERQQSLHELLAPLERSKRAK